MFKQNKLQWVLILLIILSIIGIVISFYMQRYKDETKANLILEQIFSPHDNDNSNLYSDYYNVTTIKYNLQNICKGFLTLLIVILLFFRQKGITKIHDVCKVKTIYKPSKYLLLNNLSIILIFFGLIESLIMEDSQYPIYDNSAAAIFGSFTLLLISLIGGNIFISIFLIQKRQMGELFNIDLTTIRKKLYGILIIIPVSLVSVLLIIMIYYGVSTGIIGFLILLFILISLLTELNYKNNCA